MCEYAEIENIQLSNGKTVKEVNENVRKEVEHIYLEGWAKGISIPFWDKQGNFYLANPDGSEDLVEFNRKERSYKVISRVADKGKGRYAYLLKRPEFTVIAGANGAGKSRLSPYYLHCKSFDGDLLALNLRKEHPDWIERWISGTVASELQKQKDEAIAQHKDFAFETNFSNDLILNMIGEFKEAGYKISLLYFGLGSLEESTTRVMQRKLFGGHDVANEIIEYNFYEGIKRVQENLHLFDNITFVDGNSNYGEIVAIYIKKSAKHEITNQSYEWFNRFFAEAFDKLK